VRKFSRSEIAGVVILLLMISMAMPLGQKFHANAMPILQFIAGLGYALVFLEIASYPLVGTVILVKKIYNASTKVKHAI
jgi:uncharacterized membrane protein YdcZ (DUF606 family)